MAAPRPGHHPAPALDGVRVLDLSRLLPGPYATLVLADLGAEVVKVEDPAGDPVRAVGGPGAFAALNRGKRSIVLDLKAAGGPEALLRLARGFDVLVESFRPGVLDRLGAGHAALRAANPRLVVCAVTGYGQTGPYRGLAGHDLDYCALAGALALNGPAEAPLPLGVQVADLAGGSWVAVAGILAALLRRQATGEGGVVDVSMAEGALGLTALPLGLAAERGEPMRRGREVLLGGAACYRTYRASCGRFVALGALEPRFFERFCRAVGRPELAARQLEGGGRGPVEELEALFATRTREAWAALGREQDLCLAPVLEGDEPERDPHLAARGAFLEVSLESGAALRTPATPVRLDGPRPAPRPAPALGADTAAVLREAGFSDGEIEALQRGGVVP